MVIKCKLSKEGQNRVLKIIKKMGIENEAFKNKTSEAWLDKAYKKRDQEKHLWSELNIHSGITLTAWKNFYSGRFIDLEVFSIFCQVLEIDDWENICETNDEEKFLGREEQITEISDNVQTKSIIIVEGEGGIGKTTLCENFFKDHEYDTKLSLAISREGEIASAEQTVERWLTELQCETSDYSNNLKTLFKQMKEQKIGILIDNFELLLDQRGRIKEDFISYYELIEKSTNYTLSSQRSVILITSCASVNHFDTIKNSIKNIDIKGLNQKVWYQYFDFVKNTTRQESILEKIRLKFGGNPLAMKLCKSVIMYNCKNDIEYFYNNINKLLGEKPELKALVERQFTEIYNIDPIAYKLLCRLGAFRYQDIPKIENSYLTNLLSDELKDENINRQKRLIIEKVDLLFNRKLIDKKGTLIYLHSYIIYEAVKRCKEEKEWEKVNRKIAEYFDSYKSVKKRDEAILVLEAYYHYKEIEDFESAAKVIIKDRNEENSPSYTKFETLGMAFYRLGLYENALKVCEDIIVEIENALKVREDLVKQRILRYLKCRICNILGEHYLFFGEIGKALNYYEQSGTIARDNIKESVDCTVTEDKRRTYVNLFIVSFYNRGLAHLERLEINKAIYFFTLAVNNSTKYSNIFEPYIKGSEFLRDIYCPILNDINPFIDSSTTQDFFDNLINFYLTDNENYINYSSPWAFGYFGDIFGVACLYIKNYKKAESIYKKLLAKAKKMNYKQWQAKALIGFSKLNRIDKNYSLAIKQLEDAVRILEDIKCQRDLAKAYSEMGITYKEQNKLEESNQWQAKALILFSKLNRIDKNYSLAIKQLEDAVRILEDIKYPRDLAEAYSEMGITYKEQKNFIKSKKN